MKRKKANQRRQLYTVIVDSPSRCPTPLRVAGQLPTIQLARIYNRDSEMSREKLTELVNRRKCPEIGSSESMGEFYFRLRNSLRYHFLWLRHFSWLWGFHRVFQWLLFPRLRLLVPQAAPPDFPRQPRNPKFQPQSKEPAFHLSPLLISGTFRRLGRPCSDSSPPRRREVSGRTERRPCRASRPVRASRSVPWPR